MADLTVDVLTFQNGSVLDPSNWPKLSCTSANQLSLEVSSLRLDGGRELFFRDMGQIRCFDDHHRLVFNRPALRLELHEQGDISFHTGGPPPTERMVILADGKVGIGVANPGASLEVAGFIRASDGVESNAAKKMQVGTRQAQPLELLTNNKAALTIDAAGKIGIGLVNPGTKLAVATPTDSYGISHTDGVATLSTFVGAGTTGVTNGGWIGTVSNHDLRFFTANGPPRMAITTSGNVGIGTTTPFSQLTLTGSVGFTNAATPMMFIFQSGTTNPERGIAVHSPNFQNWGLFYNDNADQMIFRFGGNPTLAVGNGAVGIGTTTPTRTLDIRATNGIKLGLEGSGGGQLILANNLNDNKIFLEAFSADGNGSATEFLLTGKWGNPAPQITLVANSTVTSGNFIVQGAAFKPGGGFWGSSSDQRLKRKIEPLTGALEKLLQLRGVCFEWAEPEKMGNQYGLQRGLIAQEVESVFPEWISADTDGYKLLTIMGFEALMIEALRELKSEIESLKAQLVEGDGKRPSRSQGNNR